VGYELSSRRAHQVGIPAGRGRRTKTYILYPEVTLFETVPLVRLIVPMARSS